MVFWNDISINPGVWHILRSLDFTVTLLQLLAEDFQRNLEEAVDESYNITLKPWHGWISSAAYKVIIIYT